MFLGIRKRKKFIRKQWKTLIGIGIKMKHCFWKIYQWPKGKVLKGSGIFWLGNRVDNFDWDQDQKSTYYHIMGSYYYKGKKAA